MLGSALAFGFGSAAEREQFAASLASLKTAAATSSFAVTRAAGSVEQYFSYYGQLMFQQNMLQDAVRTGHYRRAFHENYLDFHGKIVVDVGAGSGILSFFAVQAGARRVYAIEASDAATACAALVKANGPAETILVVRGKVEEVSLPERADILISEPVRQLARAAIRPCHTAAYLSS